MDMASSQPQTPFNMTLMASPTATNHSLFTNPVIYATLAVGLLSIYIISQPWSKSVNVPIIFSEIRNSQDRKQQYLTNPRNLLVKGYQTFGDRIWAIDTSQGLKLVLPISYLDELKSHPALSFLASINNDALVHYTGVGGLTDPVLQIFKAKFNPSLPSYTPVMHCEILQELPKIFPNTKQDGWVETPVYEKMLHLASILSTRAFYGAAASKDSAWLELAGAYISTAIEYVEALKRWPAITRPVIRFFLPQRALVVRYWDQARAHLSASLKAKASGLVNNPPSLFDHIVDASGGRVNVDDLIHTQMALVVAGIHTSAAALTQFLYDIAVHPESIEELREEATRVRESVGGTFTKQSLAELKKLDSWVKESQRLSSADLTTFQRMSTAPLTLKSGFHIPRGTKLESATAAIHADDAFLPNAASFDGLRYYNMRQCADHAVRHQYISTGKADLSWGYGRHACPGRFFADIEIKMVLAEFLIHFEVKNPEGQGRYANLEFEANVMPNPSKTVFVRSVKPW